MHVNVENSLQEFKENLNIVICENGNPEITNKSVSAMHNDFMHNIKEPMNKLNVGKMLVKESTGPVVLG